MGYAAKSDVTFTEIAGEKFSEFANLASHHCDGWGVGTSDDTQANLLVDAKSAYQNQNFDRIMQNDKHQAALLHLRWATLDLSINEANTHPFTLGEYAFIHNGSINPPASLENFIDADLLSTARGDTDSERYFLSLMSALRGLDGDARTDAIAGTVNKIWTQCTCSSINAMLLSKDFLYVISKFNVEKRPKGEPEDYYNLAYRMDESGVVVASSGWDQSGWNEIPNNTLIIIDRQNLKLERRAL